MQWRDNRGEIIPHSSKSYSQDGSRLLYMKLTLLLRNHMAGYIICCVSNPLSGEYLVVVVWLSAWKHKEKTNEIIKVK